MTSEAALLKEAYALLALWNCQLKQSAQYVTHKKVRDLLDRIKEAGHDQ